MTQQISIRPQRCDPGYIHCMLFLESAEQGWDLVSFRQQQQSTDIRTRTHRHTLGHIHMHTRARGFGVYFLVSFSAMLEAFIPLALGHRGRHWLPAPCLSSREPPLMWPTYKNRREGARQPLGAVTHSRLNSNFCTGPPLRDKPAQALCIFCLLLSRAVSQVLGVEDIPPVASRSARMWACASY